MATWTEQMRVFLDRRGKERGRNLDVLHRQAKADAERMVACIRDTYRPTRILQWGSVIETEFRELLLQKGRIVYER